MVIEERKKQEAMDNLVEEFYKLKAEIRA